jgi:hypothetical protein
MSYRDQNGLYLQYRGGWATKEERRGQVLYKVKVSVIQIHSKQEVSRDFAPVSLFMHSCSLPLAFVLLSFITWLIDWIPMHLV